MTTTLKQIKKPPKFDEFKQLFIQGFYLIPEDETTKTQKDKYPKLYFEGGSVGRFIKLFMEKEIED